VTPIAETMAAALNAAFARDPAAFHALLNVYVPCNAALAGGPLLATGPECDAPEDAPVRALAVFGMINGCLAAAGVGALLTMRSRKTGVLCDKIPFGAEPDPDAPALDPALTAEMVAALNEARRLDPAAVQCLFKLVVPCAEALADDPFVVVDEIRLVDEAGDRTEFVATPLGTLNGCLAAAGLPKIASCWDDEARLTGFRVFDPQDVAPWRDDESAHQDA
jgi:hypothetical protein